MNHRPFEDWLLDDQPLTAQQERDLHAHVRSCTSCAAIAESNLALHSTRKLPPRVGFTDRFKVRLAHWRRDQRRRQIVGTLVLVIGGLAVLYYLVGPTIQEALRSPAGWIAAAARYLVFALTSLRVLSEVSGILLRDVPSFISPGGWLLAVVIGSGLGLVWVFAARRLTHAQQGV
jgi:hypothetical protein